MSGIENLALFIAATVSTLLGFVTVVFVFWAAIEGKWTKDKLKQNKPIVNLFKFLVLVAVILVFLCFVTLYNATVSPNGGWQPIFLTIDSIGFLAFIVFMSYFFVSILGNIMGNKK